LNQTNQINQMNQRDQMNQSVGLARLSFGVLSQ
jgi:hypothetical protein